MDKFRFSGARNVVNTRTITNQVGPDVAGVTTKRSLPAFSDDNTIYVAKSGSDANAGTNAAPKLTIQNACYNAYASSRSYVVVKDCGTYTEVVDAYGAQIFAAANQRPILQAPETTTPVWDGLYESGGVFYDAPPALQEVDYYGTKEFSLPGVDAGVHFTGNISDMKKFKNLYFIISSNGIWWSASGVGAWKIVSGTATVMFTYPVISQDKLYVYNGANGWAYEIVVDSNSDSYVTSNQRYNFGLITDATPVTLIGNDNFLGAIKANADYTVYTCNFLIGGKVSSFTYNNIYTPDKLVDPKNEPFVVNGENYIVTHSWRFGSATDSYMILIKAPKFTDDASTFNINSVANVNKQFNLPAIAEYIQSRIRAAIQVSDNKYIMTIGTNGTFYIYNLTLNSSTLSIVQDTTAISGLAMLRNDLDGINKTRYWAGVVGGGSIFYLDNPADTNYHSLVEYRTIPAGSYISGCAVIESVNYGQIIICRTFNNGGSNTKTSGIAIKPSVLIRNYTRINGFKIDGRSIAATGLYPRSYPVDGLVQTQYNHIYDFNVNGLLDREYPGQRSYISNCMFERCGNGVHVTDQGGGLPRLLNNVIKNCQYGFLNESYFGVYGPVIYQCAIFNNSVAGVWVELVGQQVSTVDPVVSQIGQSIIWNNGIDLYIDNQYLRATLSDNIQSTFLRLYSIPTTKVITSIYQYDPLLLPNGDYQDTYGGYAFDSQAVFAVAGPFTYTRFRTSTDEIDYTFDYLPVSIDTQWKACNFTSAEDGQGNYIESWDGMKRAINLSWDANSMSTKTELNKYLDMIRKEDAVFKFGQTTNGTDWVNLLDVTPTVEELNDGDVLITRANHPVCAKNEWVGYWIEVYDNVSKNLIYLRINGNTAGDGLTPVTFTVDHPGDYFSIQAGNTFKIVYLTVKIDKSQQFGVSRYGYVQTPDTGYSLTLREVDRYE